MPADAASLFEAFFRELTRREIPFVILHGYERMPEEMPSDIDYAVRDVDLPKLLPLQREVAARQGWVLASVVYAKLHALYTVFYDPQNPERFIQLDACGHYVEGGCLILRDTDLLEQRRPHRFLFGPPPGGEFAYFVGKALIKRQPIDKYRERMRTLAQADPAATGAYFEKLTGEPAGQLTAWLDRPAVDWEQQLRPRLYSRTRLGPANLLREFGRALRRIFNPVGLHVVFMGPDGAGKSTLISRLGTLGCFRRQRLFHFRPSTFERSKNAPVSRPHDQIPRSRGASILKTVYYLADHAVGYWLRVFPARVRNELVIFDRSFEDLMIDPRRYRMTNVRGLAGVLRKFLSRPDLTFILDADPELIHARKPELPVAELTRQREVLRQLAKTTARCTVVSAAQPADEVERTVRRAVIRFLAERENKNHPPHPS